VNRAFLLPPLILLASCSGSDSHSATQTLRFTAIPGENTSEMVGAFAQVATYLSEQLEIPVEYVHVSDYTASVEAFKNGDVQLAWFGGLTGVRARNAIPGALAIAQGRVDPEYKCYFVASSESGLEASTEFPMELEGKTFTFGSNSSTSGRLMPEYYIRKFTDRSPAEFFGMQMNFSQSHTRTAKLVEAGSYDAGAISYKTYERMVDDGSLDPDRCRVIWVSPPFPDYSWHAHPDLDVSYGAGFIDKVQKVLVGISDPELLRAMQREEGLIEASNEAFAPLEELARELGLVR
jgi:phosphonate transport system substrate-binding protein